MSATIAVQAQLYLYGLLDAASDLDPAALGQGVTGSDVNLSMQGPFRALTSHVAPGAVPQTRRNMLAHTAVLERAMVDATVLPMRFGTVVPALDTLRACVVRNAEPFATALRSIDGRVELGVKASWRDRVVYSEIIESDPSLFRIRNRLRDRPANETYYERVELGRRIETALAVRRSAEAAAILAELQPLADRDVELRTLEDDMILNRAFLVPRRNEPAFDTAMERLGERHGARITFRYVGPVPPYNFIQLHADWLAGGT